MQNPAPRSLFRVDVSGYPQKELTRKENALDRRVDLWGWDPASPPAAAMYDVISSPTPGAPVKRVLFTGALWMTDSPVVGWRASDAPAPDPRFSVAALDASPHHPLDGLSLEPLDSSAWGPERRAVLALARGELGVRINVTRVFKVDENADGIVSGKVLAVSENFAAQSFGANDILIHEQANLHRQVQAGEHVTLAYVDGKAQVYDGCLYDISVSADTLDTDQRGYLRRKLLEAFSKFERPPASDKFVIEATKWALGETVKAFSLDPAKARVDRLSVEDSFSKPPAAGPALAGAPASPRDTGPRTKP